MFCLEATKGFAQLALFDSDQVETFDWSPCANTIAIASGNSIRVFSGNCFDDALQTYSDVFELEDPDGR